MQTDSLDFSREEFEKLLHKTSQMVMKQFENLQDMKGYHHHSVAEVHSWFAEPLPEYGMNAEELLGFVQTYIMDTATGNLGPNMYAYVMAGSNQWALLSEKLASTINQNQTKWHLAPALNEVEKRVINWTAQMMGFPKEAGGVMVSGGSAANLTGLTVGRNIFLEKYDIRKKGLSGLPVLRVYASEEVHGCMDKSLELLGIGSDNLVRIKTNNHFEIDLTALKKAIKNDKQMGYIPFCIVGNAGTVNTGAIDNLNALAQIADEHKLWYHIDGAYGALASMLPQHATLYKGLERADSLALDFHKWLYVHFEAGCTLVRNWDNLKRTYFKKASYLDSSLADDGERFEFNEHYFQLSRNTKAFKVWMTIKGYGMTRLKQMIQKDIALTQYLADQLLKIGEFRILSSSPLAICCFQYIGGLDNDQEISEFNQNLIPYLEKDGRVFIMGTWLKGHYALRACLINHRKTKNSCDHLVRVVTEVARQNTSQIKK